MRARLARIPAPAYAAALYLVLGAILFRHAVLGSEILSSANTIYTLEPWAGVRPADWARGLNPVVADAPYYFVPMLELVRASLHAGQLPLWNPYIMGGAPLLANEQSAALALPNLPVWVLPFQTGLLVSAMFKLWLAGMGTFLLSRRLGLSAIAACAAGVAFALGAFQITWLGHAHVNVTALLPWVLLGVELAMARPAVPAVLGLAAVSGAAFAGGHPESALIVGLAAGVYALARTPTATWRRLGLAVAGLGAGVALSAAANLPFYAGLHGSAESLALGSRAGAIPGESLITLALPDFWGRPTAAEVTAPTNFNERTLYVGAFVLLLAVLALSARGRMRRFAPLLCVGVLGLVTCTDATWLGGVLRGLPLLDQLAAGRMQVLVGLTVAVLGGAGIDAVVRREETRGARRLAFGAAAALGLAVLVAAHPPLDRLGRVLHAAAGTIDVRDAAALQAGAALRWLAFAGVLGLVLWLARRRRRVGLALAPLLLALVIADSVRFADGYQPTIPPSRNYEPLPPSVAWLQAHTGHDRFTARYLMFPSDVNQLMRLRDIRAKDFPKPARQVRLFRHFFNQNQAPNEALGVATVNGPSAAVLGAMGVRYVMDVPDAPNPDPAAYRRVYAGRDAVIWENRRALPRAYVARAVTRAGSEAEALALMAAPAFDPRRSVVVESADPSLDGERNRGTVSFRTDDPERVVLDATLAHDGLVVLADSWADGWSVTVDGRPAQALRATSVDRAVRVPAGRHTIAWAYRPPAVRAGFAVSLATLGALVLLAAGWAIRTRVRRERV